MYKYLFASAISLVLLTVYMLLVVKPPRILLIGNSFTHFNGGVDRQLMWLNGVVSVRSVARGGYTLERHWDQGEALAVIRRGKWDYVVLQESSQTPVLARETFFKYVRKFDREITGQGGRTVLFMTWERPDAVAAGVTTKSLTDAYFEIGRELGVPVAPVGLAFAESYRARPDITLSKADGHPTPEGTYLAACVISGTIFNRKALAGWLFNRDIAPERREYLQDIAGRVLGY